jgi:replicative DNA helicase
MTNEDLEKIETQPQLEVILKSINNENIEMLKPILESEEIDDIIKARVKKYIKLVDINKGNNIDGTTLLREFPELDFNGISSITEEELASYINVYLFKEKSKSTARTLLELSNNIREKGFSEDVLDKLSALTKSDTIRHKFHNVKDDLVENYENQEFNAGLNTGVSFVDETTGGIHKGEISTIVAFTGHCKTTWAVNICYNALIQKQNVLYLTLEVPADSLYIDFLSRHSNSNKFKGRKINHANFKQKLLKPEEWKFVKESLKPDFDSLPGRLYIVGEKELDNYSIFGLEAKFREVDKIATEETGHGIDIIAIDHMQLLKFKSGHQTTNTGEVINEYVSWFRQIR